MEPGGVLPHFWELKRKPRLLVVEDDNDVGNLLKICFTELGVDVTVTVMGRERPGALLHPIIRPGDARRQLAGYRRV